MLTKLVTTPSCLNTRTRNGSQFCKQPIWLGYFLTTDYQVQKIKANFG